MRIKLTKYGRLEIDGKPRNCPHNHMSCGDWCALFSVKAWSYEVPDEDKGVHIGLCQRSYEVPIEGFTDEREVQE